MSDSKVDVDGKKYPRGTSVKKYEKNGVSVTEITKPPILVKTFVEYKTYDKDGNVKIFKTDKLSKEERPSSYQESKVQNSQKIQRDSYVYGEPLISYRNHPRTSFQDA